jgi:hypothetical protein
MPMADDEHAADRGAGLVNLDLCGTGVLVLTSAAAAIAPDALAVVHAGLSLALSVIGTGALLWAYALGISRSRTELVSIPGLFLLASPAAPVPTRRTFHLALAVQVIAVVVAASIRPFSDVAFGILAPMYGLGLMALWGGRYGEFPPRPVREGS